MLDGRALVSLPATPRSIIYYQKYFMFFLQIWKTFRIFAYEKLENNDL